MPEPDAPSMPTAAPVRRGGRRSALAVAVRVARALKLAKLVRLALKPLPRRFAVAFAGRVYAANQAAGDTMSHVAEEELGQQLVAALARLGEAPTGAYLEFGVYSGATMTVFDRVREAAGLDDMRLVGFDSFEGMPAHAGSEGAGFSRPGMFKATAAQARANLESGGVDLSRVELVPGWFEDTLTPATRERLGLQRAAVIMLDCDLGSAATLALDFAAPLIGERVVVVLDDWVHGGPTGEQQAWREFLAGHPELAATELGSYRAGGHPDGGRVWLLERDSAASEAPA